MPKFKTNQIIKNRFTGKVIGEFCQYEGRTGLVWDIDNCLVQYDNIDKLASPAGREDAQNFLKEFANNNTEYPKHLF